MLFEHYLLFMMFTFSWLTGTQYVIAGFWSSKQEGMPNCQIGTSCF